MRFGGGKLCAKEPRLPGQGRDVALHVALRRRYRRYSTVHGHRNLSFCLLLRLLLFLIGAAYKR